MSIYRGNKSISAIYRGSKKVSKIYRGTNLVYQSKIQKSFFVQFVEDNLEDGWIKAEYFEDVTTIRAYAFHNKKSITRIDLPNTVTGIGQHAFSGCDNLVEINLNEGLKSFGDSALSSLASLATITIPSTVTSVGYNFLDACTNLTVVKLLPTTPPSAGSSVLAGGSTQNLVRVEVPAEALSAYQTAELWSNVAEYMVGV